MAKGKSIGTTHVGITADIAGFTKAMDKVSKRLGNVGKNLTQMGKTMSMRLTAPIAALGTVSVAAFAKQESAVNALNAALRTSGQEVEQNSKRYQALAAEIQKTTTFGDEQTIQLMATATNMGIQSDKIEEATKGAIGLSKAFGLDLKMSMRAVSAALQGDTMLLTRYIPQLRSTSDEGERLAIVQRAMASGFTQAQAETETTAGKLQMMRNAVGDLMETIGATIAPILTPLVEKIQSLAERLQNVNPATIRFGVVIAAVAAAIGPLLIASGLLITSLGKVLSVVKTIGVFLAGPLVLAIGIAVAAFAMFTDSGQKFMQSFAGPKIAASIRHFGVLLAAKASEFGWKMVENIINLGKYIKAIVWGAFLWVMEKFGNSIRMTFERARILGIEMMIELRKMNPFADEDVTAALEEGLKAARIGVERLGEALDRNTKTFGEAMQEAIVNVELSTLASGMKEISDRWVEDSKKGIDAIADGFDESESIVAKIKDMLGLGGDAIKTGAEEGAKILEETLSRVSGFVADITGKPKTEEPKPKSGWSMEDEVDRPASGGRSFASTLSGSAAATKTAGETIHDAARRFNDSMEGIGDYVKVEVVDEKGNKMFRLFEDGFKGELMTQEEMEKRLDEISEDTGGGGGGGGGESSNNPLETIADHLESIKSTLSALEGAVA